MSPNQPRGSLRVELVADRDGATFREEHEVALEEPLEIRVAGEPVALTMRTPGADRFLALGFLFAEGVISSLSDVGSVYHCGRTNDPRYGNVVEVSAGPGVHLDPERLTRARRVGITTSACGVCGRDGIDDLLQRARPAGSRTIDKTLLREVPALLAREQSLFARTGGVHAACAIDEEGTLLAHAEDVGRHNAVDKVIGKLLYDGLVPARAHLLAVSSRASFEIVQKAAAAGFSCVASLSAPSSLAIETARALGLTLAAFVRDGRFSLYAHSDRVV